MLFRRWWRWKCLRWWRSWLWKWSKYLTVLYIKTNVFCNLYFLFYIMSTNFVYRIQLKNRKNSLLW